MRQQHEITTSGPLLGSDGNLLEPGWARSMLPVYRRADIKASAMRDVPHPGHCSPVTSRNRHGIRNGVCRIKNA